MSQGKAIAQAGHAYVDTLIASFRTHPDEAAVYSALFPGTKISLDGGSLSHILALHQRLQALNIPSILITDQDHVEPPDFDGSPVVTALGIGPVRKDGIHHLVRKLRLWPPKGGPT